MPWRRHRQSGLSCGVTSTKRGRGLLRRAWRGSHEPIFAFALWFVTVTLALVLWMLRIYGA